jgi:hypothetical protein
VHLGHGAPIEDAKFEGLVVTDDLGEPLERRAALPSYTRPMIRVEDYTYRDDCVRPI